MFHFSPRSFLLPLPSLCHSSSFIVSVFSLSLSLLYLFFCSPILPSLLLRPFTFTLPSFQLYLILILSSSPPPFLFLTSFLLSVLRLLVHLGFFCYLLFLRFFCMTFFLSSFLLFLPSSSLLISSYISLSLSLSRPLSLTLYLSLSVSLSLSLCVSLSLPLSLSLSLSYSLEYKDYILNLWDVGGQKSIRTYWRNYFELTDGIIWVRDYINRCYFK